MFYTIIFIYYVIGGVIVEMIDRSFYYSIGIDYKRMTELSRNRRYTLPTNLFRISIRMITTFIAMTFWWIYFMIMTVAIGIINSNPVIKEDLQKTYLKDYDKTILLPEKSRD